ncbi:phenylalanine--tRNA ligase subunit beta [Anaerotalea alkaliphila]|uniref:Phenylalanine--tRNA ligase beta subunit n=1 Tax=Anaerotalea alkaliphila TaxID=2662126 RepID=A0A7X5KMM0_9FIRM|nr:phenylalanine--tRNA ligase subunit beta [Anaerotalea alkaliphila]NDL67094.1 phenylalanine--tRNA ligase subunit beta [Anaerotalea alkaliphila]
MHVPMNWLKEYVPLENDLVSYMDGMTMSGTKVEGCKKLGEDIQKVVVGKILSIEPHEDADKLVVTQVDVGTEVLQIVTGATNIQVGDHVPVALAGAKLAEGLEIKKGKLRGVESNGMMCSVEELGLTREDFPDAPEHGIYILEPDYALGSDAKPVFALDEVVVEYEVTSNRPDCFSILGIAREAAATFGLPFNPPSPAFEVIPKAEEDTVEVEIQEPALCARFMGRIVRNVQVGPSPKWLQRKLVSAGLRPINNVVDITNFVMLEMGQPMHAYDLDKLEGGRICVRKAGVGEKILCLDGAERALDDGMLVIADAAKPVGIAGIIGGEDTKVTETTTSILFEAANFDGTNVRMSSKRLGLRTDASTKFEKYLDPNNVAAAIGRACELITMLGAGQVVDLELDNYPIKRFPVEIAYAPQWINGLLGTDIPEEEMVRYFEAVGCQVDRKARKVTAPTFRPDLEGEADLAEEVARFYGYDRIPVTLAAGTPTVGKKNFKQKIEDLARLVMEDCGLSEAMTYSFESPKAMDKLLLDPEDDLRSAVRIINPLGEDFSVMRTTPMNGMLGSLATNYNRRNEQAWLYEIASIYIPKSQPVRELPDEQQKLTIGMYGECTFYDAKGVLETLLDRLGMLEETSFELEKTLHFLHPGRRAEVFYRNKSIGYVGEVHPQVADAYGIGERPYVGVLDMKALVRGADLEHKYTPVPKYPAVNRDLALLAKDEVLVGQIEKLIRQKSGKMLESLVLFDVYKGKQIQEGCKSIAYSLTFRAADRTLGEKEISKTVSKILEGLEEELGVTIRQ